MGNRKGFTLAELLVVVAILAILVAVSIPIFSGKLDEAKAATCAANCRNLKAELSAEYLQSGTLNGKSPATGPITLTTEQTKNYTCPSGGTISAKFDNNAVFLTVTCSKHGGGGSFGDSETISSLYDVFKAVTMTIDSGGAIQSDSNTSEALKSLAKRNLNLEELGAVSWQYKKDSTNGDSLYWSPENISATNITVGTQMPVYKYNFKQKKYTVWIATIDTTTTKNNNIQSEPYNRFGGYTKYAPSTEVDQAANNQTFEQAQIRYNECLKTLNKN